uniref:Uncharacterized protein n=1 Tax=Anguilla anguilla TaxID=7936 RepID=A0A0E9VY62_ANGAN
MCLEILHILFSNINRLGNGLFYLQLGHSFGQFSTS